MKIKRIILCLLMLQVIAFGAALTLKASVGVSAWDALAKVGSSITGIRVGTVGMICNFICIFIQLIILKRDFKIKQALQIVLCFVVGYAVNFFFYDVLGRIDLSNYFLRVTILILGYVLSAFTVAVIMLLNVVTFALEGACKAICDRTGIRFHIFRQGVDIVCIIISVIMSLAFHVPFVIREGTIIGMIIFSPIMGAFMKLLKPIFRKYDLTDYE